MKTKKNKLGKIKHIPLVLSILILLSSAISLVTSTPSFAESPLTGLSSSPDFAKLGDFVTPEAQAESANYYQILTGCFWHATDGKIKADNSNPDPSLWFNKSSQTAAYNDGAKTNCTDVAQAALSLWGWGSNYGDFLTSSGCTYNGTSQYTCSSNDQTRANNFQHAVLTKVYPSLSPTNYNDNAITLQPASLYIRSLNTFENQCSPTDLGTMDSIKANSDPTTLNRITQNYYSITNYKATVYDSLKIADGNSFSLHGITFQTTTRKKTDQGTTFRSVLIGFAGDPSLNTYGHINQNTHNIDNTNLLRTCYELFDSVSTNASAYAKYLIDHPNTASSTTGIKTGTGGTNSSSKTTCDISGVGWIICPIVNFMASVADKSYGFLTDNYLLSVSPKFFDTSSGLYTAWSTMRNIANVAFVAAFLIIIFSQLTGFFIDNYGIKKLLPKIIIAAILVNLSYFICQIAVDLSNIIGFSLKDLLVGLGPKGASSVSGASVAGYWVATTGTILATAAAAWAALASLIPILVSVLFTIILIVLILGARQALIVLLIFISPLAFVAYLLPNTEKWYKMWQKTFVAMLLLFPIVALVFGASNLASQILVDTFAFVGAAASGTEPGILGKTIMGIIARGVAVIPLLAVPIILKKSLDGIGNVGATMNGWRDKISGSAGKRIANDSRLGQYAKYKDEQSGLRRAQVQSGSYEGRGGKYNPRNWASALNKRVNQSRYSGQFGDRSSAQGAALSSAAGTELVKNAGSRLDSMEFDGIPLSQAQMMQIATGQSVTNAGGSVVADAKTFDSSTRQAAIERAAKTANVADAHKLVDAAGNKVGGKNTMSADERKTLANALAGSSAVGKASYLGGGTLGKIIEGSVSSDAAALSAIQGGKITSEALANSDADAVDKLYAVAAATPAGSAERGALVAATQGIIAPGSTLREKVAAGGAHDQALGRLASL